MRMGSTTFKSGATYHPSRFIGKGQFGPTFPTRSGDQNGGYAPLSASISVPAFPTSSPIFLPTRLIRTKHQVLDTRIVCFSKYLICPFGNGDPVNEFPLVEEILVTGHGRCYVQARDPRPLFINFAHLDSSAFDASSKLQSASLVGISTRLSPSHTKSVLRTTK